MSAVSKPPVNCPSCGETNEEDMQFCIFCGQPLAVSESDPEDQHPLEEMVAPGPQMVLVCTVCQRTDPLHGQFCVFCGSRTHTADASQVPQRQTYVPLLDRGGSSRVSGEYPYPTYKQSSSVGSTIGMMLLFGLSGLGLGVGGVFLARQDIQAEVSKARDSMVAMKLWPTDGLVLYSEARNANVCIQDNDEKSFIFGVTGENGSLAVNHIAPGKYRVKVEGLKTKVANVTAGKAEIIGYPDRIKADNQRMEGF